jgi:hypothetical protein
VELARAMGEGNGGVRGSERRVRVRGWLVALALLAIGALLSTAVGSYRRSIGTAYRGELKWNDSLCDFAVTWSGQYRGARPTPCRGDAMSYLEHWMPIILPDGRRLQPPKWKPGRVKESGAPERKRLPNPVA